MYTCTEEIIAIKGGKSRTTEAVNSQLEAKCIPESRSFRTFIISLYEEKTISGLCCPLEVGMSGRFRHS